MPWALHRKEIRRKNRESKQASLQVGKDSKVKDKVNCSDDPNLANLEVMMATVLDKFCDSYGEGSIDKSAARIVLETKYRDELHRMRQSRLKIPPDMRIMAKMLMERIVQSAKEELKIAEGHSAEGEHPDPIAKSSREGVPEELQRWRDAFTIKMAKEACRGGGPAYSAGIFCSGGCLDTFAAIRSGFKPLWGTEVHKQRGAMFEDLTGATCLGDTFAVDFKKQKQVVLLWTGQPCPDYSTSHQGRRPPGSQGKTGWQYVQQSEKILEVMPKVCVIEMVPNALQINGGEAVDQLCKAINHEYRLYIEVVKCASMGDCTARHRLLIVGIHRSVDPDGKETAFQFPTPLYDDTRFHIARDIAVPDEEVPQGYWRYDRPAMLPPSIARPLQMHKLARSGPGMGFSELPSLVQSWGTDEKPSILNTQTTHNGGGRRPTLSWKAGMPLTRTRMTVPVETVRAASLPHDYLEWCKKFNVASDVEDDRHLRECVNMGVPIRTACSVNEAIHAVLVSAGVPFDTGDTTTEGKAAEYQAQVARVENIRDRVVDYNKVRAIQVDTGASKTFMFTDVEPFLQDSADSDMRIRVASKGHVMKGNKQGKLRAHVVNKAGYKDIKHTTPFSIDATTVPELSKELLSVDDYYRYGKYNLLLRQPDYEDGVSELYRAPRPGFPAVRIPLSYDWYGIGGWHMHYVPTESATEEDMQLCEAKVEDDTLHLGKDSVMRFQQSMMNADQVQVRHEEMAANGSVVEVITRKDAEQDVQRKELQNPEPELQDQRKVTDEKVSQIWAAQPDEREMLGVKAGMKQAFKRMKRKEFHERFSHMGTCEGCELCKKVKGCMRRIRTKVDPYKETRPGYCWAMDGITFSDRSTQGNLYLVVLRDMATGAFAFIPLFKKSDVVEEFRRWVSDMRKNPLYANMPYPVVSKVRTDNESTWGYKASKWKEMIDELEVPVQMEYVCPDRHAEENGYAEAACKIVENTIKQIMMASNLGPEYPRLYS